METGCRASKMMRGSIAQTPQFSDLPPFHPGFDSLPVLTRKKIIHESILTLNRHLDDFKIRVRESPCQCNDCVDLFYSEFAAVANIIDDLLDMLVETSSETNGRSLKRRRL